MLVVFRAASPALALPALLSAVGCAPLATGSSVAGGPLGRDGATSCLNADGSSGRDTYELIESVFGPGSIETPDGDHRTPVRHVLEDTDAEVGPHFVFLVHRDVDRDRDRTDRQRMEIKVYDKSDDYLKATLGSTFTYTWRFKIGAGMTVSKKATHLFQLKGVGGDDKMPLVTLTGAKRSHGDRLEVRHTAGSPSMDVLAETDWLELRDGWLDVRCQATFSEHGALALRVSRADGRVLLELERKDIDLWRNGEFVRPKWGIYRGLQDASALRPDEERVRFANFGVTPGVEPSSDCR